MTTDAKVTLWGTTIGAVTWDSDKELAIFQYTPEIVEHGIEVAPLMMPLRTEPYSFPNLSRETFSGLPGLLSDSLPDKYGNDLINVWLSRQGRTPNSMNPIETLCYIGSRGMGALEYEPSISPKGGIDTKLDVDALSNLASEIVSNREEMSFSNRNYDDTELLSKILQVGTSAGGARAKAIVTWNGEDEFRSGQVQAREGFSHWILKFDGIAENADKELADPKGYGKIEYAYYKMALNAGISMMECVLYQESNRAHFMTRRFDRTDDGLKQHVLTLGAQQHFDFNHAGGYSYEQALQTILLLNGPVSDVEEQFRRAVFNVLARNQDDHVKNISYLMDQEGNWSLSPAYDITYSYNPSGKWTGKHQMSLNNKRGEFTKEDLFGLAKTGGIKRTKAEKIINKVQNAVSDWLSIAEAVGINEKQASEINNVLREL